MTGSEGDEGSRAPSKGPSKIGVATTAWSTYSDLKKLMEGDPMGAVGLFGDAGKWAQLLVPEAIATPVIAAGLKLLMLTSITMGEGSPDGGGAFSDGAKLFQSNGKSLEGAYPTETWSGSASDAYTAQNSHQIQRATTMLEADNAIVRILSTQAGQVDHARTQVDWASKGLAAMIPIAMALEASVLGAPESIALQVAAVATAVGFAGLAANNLLNYAQDNAAQIREATEKYRQAGAVSPSSGAGSPASPTGSGNGNGSDRPSGQDTPSDQTGPTGTGPTTTGNSGNRSGGGSGAGGGSGTGSGGGSGSGGASGSGSGRVSAASMPSTTGMSSGAVNAASSGAGMGGMPSLPQMGGGSGGGGAGALGSLAGAAGQIVESVMQTVEQADQQDPNAQNGDAGATPGQSGAATGAESQSGRAPISASFGADAANHAAPQRLTTDL